MALKAGGKGPMLSRLIRSRVTGRANIVFARRLEDEDEVFRGIAQAVLSPAYFLDFYDGLRAAGHAEVTLFRDDLAVVLRYPGLADDLATSLVKWRDPMPAGDAVPARGSALRCITADGVERIESWHKVDRTPAYVAVGLDLQGVLAGWRRAMLVQGAIGATALAIVGLLSLLWWKLAKREEALLADREHRIEVRTAELTAALAARDLLIKEVHHRVKNNLQLVRSLLSLQGKRSPNEAVRQALDEAGARVTAIADIHRNPLSAPTTPRPGSSWRPSWKSCATDLEGGRGPIPARRIAVSTEPVELPVDMVIPLAVIVVELVTNALKHAYPDGVRGDVTVAQRRDVRYGIVIEIADLGLGRPADAEPGFDSTLVQALLRQLDDRGGGDKRHAHGRQDTATGQRSLSGGTLNRGAPW